MRQASPRHPHANLHVGLMVRAVVCPLLQGTGIVTSVPSDAPDDYAALMDLGEAFLLYLVIMASSLGPLVDMWRTARAGWASWQTGSTNRPSPLARCA